MKDWVEVQVELRTLKTLEKKVSMQAKQRNPNRSEPLIRVQPAKSAHLQEWY